MEEDRGVGGSAAPAQGTAVGTNLRRFVDVRSRFVNLLHRFRAEQEKRDRGRSRPGGGALRCTPRAGLGVSTVRPALQQLEKNGTSAQHLTALRQEKE